WLWLRGLVCQRSGPQKNLEGAEMQWLTLLFTGLSASFVTQATRQAKAVLQRGTRIFVSGPSGCRGLRRQESSSAPPKATPFFATRGKRNPIDKLKQKQCANGSRETPFGGGRVEKGHAAALITIPEGAR